jgi:NAD(P)H-hydrate epimerase
MTLPLEDAGSAALGRDALPALRAAAAERDTVVVGPGLGLAPETVATVRSWLAELDRPAVVDADALNAYAGRPEELAGAGPRVLTPHPGEAARLLDRSNAEIQADRAATARELARRSRSVVLLKGARTLIADPAGSLWINPTGGPGLSAGGSGDVLAGAIAALLASGAAPSEAAALVAYLHGRSGERAGPVGVLASEVARGLPEVWRELQSEGRDDAREVQGHGTGLRRFPE